MANSLAGNIMLKPDSKYFIHDFFYTNDEPFWLLITSDAILNISDSIG